MEWPVVTLETAAEIRGGGTPRREDPTYWNGDIPWLTPSDLPPVGTGITNIRNTADSITGEGLASSSAILLPPGTVLFSSRASIGKVGIAAVPVTTNQGFANLIPRPGIEPRYLAWCVSHYAKQIASLAGSTTFKEVSKSALRRFRIPLPPASEQRRIVAILDQADQLRRRRVEADAKADRILPALFVKMFGDPTTNPMSWPVKRFDSICESRLGKMLDAKRQTGLYLRPYLRNANVYWDRLVLDDLLEMDFDDVDQREFRLQSGDILICEGGEVGRSAIWNDELPECYFQKALHRARPFPEVAVSEFVVYLLWELSRRRALQRSASRVTFAHLTGVKLKALRVPVPPIGLQQVFARRARMLKRSLNGNNTAVRLDSIFSILLYRAFSGGLSESNCGTCTTGPST